jgi:hypothetical protein
MVTKLLYEARSGHQVTINSPKARFLADWNFCKEATVDRRRMRANRKGFRARSPVGGSEVSSKVACVLISANTV